jgi:3',5'-cyclic AMP phosphodiesterase CpdA
MPGDHIIRIVCVSDTHNDDLTGQVPDGDIFLHAGDMTDDGTYDEMKKALDWIRKLPHKLKIIIPGTIFFSLGVASASGGSII